MRMKNTLMENENLDEREEGKLRGKKEDKVDIYNKELPLSEEIRARYIQREEQLLGDSSPEQKELGKNLRWYRRSNRLALTWGWFIEKNCVSGTEAHSAEVECYRVINEVLSEPGVAERDDVKTVAQIFLWQGSYERVRHYFPFLWEIWKRLPDFLERLEQEKGNPMELLTEDGWDFLACWLEAQKKEMLELPKKNSLYKKMMHCLAKGLGKERRLLGEEVGGKEQLIKHILALETDFCVDEFCSRSFLSFLFWQYCYVREGRRSRGKGKEPDAVGKRILESMHRVFRPEDNFFRVFLAKQDIRYEFDQQYITIPTLNEMFDACGGTAELDLAELSAFFWKEDGRRNVARCERKAGNKDYVWFYQNDFMDVLLVWITTNFRFTNEGGRDFFPVQMYLMQEASEEELFLMRGRGVFPDETLPRVLAETRQTRDFYKVPLLISWMHGA